MRKNGSGQVVGAQLVSATDGSAFTGAVTCRVTGDGGTQAVGSVGSGACTHEGNGFHTYAPAQAETNYDHVAFTFTGTGAVPVTVQVYTAFPQTGDSFARLGAPAGASIAADIAGVAAGAATAVWAAGTRTLTSFGTLVADIWAAATRTLTAASDSSGVTTLLSRLTGTRAGNLDNLDAAVSSRLATAGYTAPPSAATVASQVRTELTTELGRIDAATSTRATPAQVAAEIATYDAPTKAELDAGLAALNDLDAAGVRSAVGLTGADLDTQLGGLQTTADAIEADTQDIQSRLPATLNAGRLRVHVEVVEAGAIDDTALDASGEIGDAVLDEVVEGTLTLRDMVRLMAAALLGEVSGAATTTVVFRDASDTKTRITATVDADGNRSAVTLDAT